MYEIQVHVEALQKLIAKEIKKKNITNESQKNDIEMLEDSLSYFSGYRVNSFGNLVPSLSSRGS